jgi:hypothetical protein
MFSGVGAQAAATALTPRSATNFLISVSPFPALSIVAACATEGQDVGRELVRAGWALAFRRYGLDYLSIESEARAEQRGMWNASFLSPWEWRAAHPR